MAYFDARSKGLVQTNNSKHFLIDQYIHDRMTPATLSPTPLAYEKPIHPTEMPCITTCTELPVDGTNKSTSDDRYPWLDPDDIRRNMTDKEILQMKLNLKDSALDEKGKEEFLEKVEQFTDIFSLRDEIGTCPFIEVHLKLTDETPFFVRPYPMREEQKKVIQKEMDRLEHLGIIQKGLTGYSSPVVLVKQKNQNLYRVCSDFCILNKKLVKINHAFPLVRDCIEQLGRKKCHYLSTIDLRDAFHTLRLALSSQKYCGITPYYRSPTYHYLCMGMGMSVSPQIWQQFIDLVFQDDLIKRKQNFDVIMDDTFIHSTAEEHMYDLMEGVGGTLLQKQGDEWVVIGYHSKRLPKSAKNFGITELELTGLLVNIHDFMQLLHNRDFKVLVDHKAIEYMIKSKTESPMTRLKTLLLKLSEYTMELKCQKGSKMHTSDTLSRLYNFTDTPDQKGVIPLNFLQHYTPNYIEHSYSHLVENLYAHNTKTLDATTVKRKRGRPPKPKPQIPSSKTRTMTAAKNLTT